MFTLHLKHFEGTQGLDFQVEDSDVLSSNSGFWVSVKRNSVPYSILDSYFKSREHSNAATMFNTQGNTVWVFISVECINFVEGNQMPKAI